MGAAFAGLALALACDLLQVHYSREARPDSPLVLGTTLSMPLWQQLLTRPTRRSLVAYALVTTLAVYAHFLAAFTLFGQAGWWIQCELRRPDRRRLRLALIALLATVPALLIPLLVARRFHRHGPLLVGGLAVVLSLPALYSSRSTLPLGFQELTFFLQERVDPSAAAVVHAIESVAPKCVELERLAFRYYPLSAVGVRDWLLNKPPVDGEESVLSDPRRLYVVTFRADPRPAIRAARRPIEPFVLEGRRYAELAFGPYQLLKVAPLSPASDSSSSFLP